MASAARGCVRVLRNGLIRSVRRVCRCHQCAAGEGDAPDIDVRADADGLGTMHLVVWLPWDEAESRIAAGLAAGGRVVRHNIEEKFWTLADPAGNEVDVATTSAPGQAPNG
jgi:Glyoxalase-like domain